MIAAHAEFLGKAFKNAQASILDDGGFAVHGVIEDSELSSEGFDHSLEAQTDAEYWYFQFRGVADQIRDAEIDGAAGAGRDKNERRRYLLNQIEIKSRAIGDYFRAGLTHVVGQGVDKAVFVIDQKEAD